MPAVTSALLRLYPRAWRRRYGPEMQALLADQKVSARTLADLIAGAIDARLNPQSTTLQGATAMTKATFCTPVGVTTADQLRSAGWMIGGSLLLTALSLVLKLQLGSNALSEGLIYAAFPASMMLSMECTYLKRYSRAARTTIAIGGAVFIVLMMWASVAIAYRI